MIYILLIPLITAVICYNLRGPKVSGYVSLGGSIVLSLVAFPFIREAFTSPLMILNGNLYMDSLSAYIMSLVIFLGIASSAYSTGYIAHEFQVGLIDLKGMRRYYALLHLFIFTMLLVTASNNLALLWIAVEATTIVSAVLIGLGYTKRPMAIEAAWKYVILCTVGITFALLGTFITYYASTGVTGSNGLLLWTDLKATAHKFNPSTMKLAFIFILVGYGTKAGLAPVHNWLPDAHSEAPSPISALLSGILLNTAFYGILRFVSIVEPSTGNLFTGNLLILFGLISIGISTIFILVQENYKRLLAYSSIEHMGIISLGIGIGGFAGLYGSLLHILNHALAKPLMFFTSGKIQSHYGSTRIERVGGVLSSMPFLGVLTFIGALSLSGTPPFNIFLSEFTILKAGVDRGLWLVVSLFLIFAVMIFYGMLSGFGRMLFGSKTEGISHGESLHSQIDLFSGAILLLMAIFIIVLGIRVPDFIDSAIRSCISIMER
ncbi:MAG: hydrogenase 4 subunit F [Thermodesulfovibrionales bacterium]